MKQLELVALVDWRTLQPPEICPPTPSLLVRSSVSLTDLIWAVPRLSSVGVAA